MLGLKSAVAAITVATMVASSALAAETAPLAPGKPAGVHQADLGIGRGTLIIGLGAIAVITAVAIVVSNNGNNTPAPNTFGNPSGTSP
ncbi:MAG TPA: hypothetical protein VIG39_02445 [Rhizomicrobium sp.]|jgi:ABC-type uncharacterized transport system permease subunit